MTESSERRLVAITFDEAMAVAASADAEHERRVAIYDILENNLFAPVNHAGGPYRLNMSAAGGRLSLEITDEHRAPVITIVLAMSPLRRIVRDYFLICDSYYQAIRQATPSQIETIDMARRGLHNEGADILAERLRGKVEADPKTIRRLFTLVSVLFWRG